MNSRIVLSRLLILLMVFNGLVSCNRFDNVGQNSEFGNVTEGFSGNLIAEGVRGGTISGGGQIAFSNQVLLDFGVIAGGRGNSVGNLSTVGGGESNHAEGIRATIGGGAKNIASRNSAVVAGGFSNTASQSFATVGGGNVNTADGSNATVSGGAGNLASGRMSTIGGGTRNQAQSAYATIGGGFFNEAIGGTSTIGGGTRNYTLGIGSIVGGGAGNHAVGLQSTITGGLSNRVTDNYGTVTGGRGNVSGNLNDDSEDAPYTSVGGGYWNQAGGAYSTVPGGFGNLALGDYSFAAGSQAQIDLKHSGAFLFADSSDFPFVSSRPDEFAVRATGGVRFVTALDEDGAPLIGVRLTPGSGSWETLSDRDAKTAILPVDERQVLDTLMNVPISTWRYVGQSDQIRHIGPVAQDFYAAFSLGQDEHYIGSVDADGVALAAIQGLHQVVQEKDSQIAALQTENSDQEERLDVLEKRLTELEDFSNQPRSLPGESVIAVLFFVIGLALGRLSLVSHRSPKVS